MTPYMAFLLQPMTEILHGLKEGLGENEMWLAIIHTLAKSFVYDEGGTWHVGSSLRPSIDSTSAAFWREDKLRQLIAPLMAQVPLCLDANLPDMRDTLKECLVALVDVVNDPASLKSVNLDLLMHTRSEDARVRIYSLSCSEALWRSHGGKLIGKSFFPAVLSSAAEGALSPGFAPETATFIAECAEDDNDSVVREAHRLKNAVESIAGRIIDV